MPIRASNRDECLHNCALTNVIASISTPNKWRIPEVASCSSEHHKKLSTLNFILERYALRFIRDVSIARMCESKCSPESNISRRSGVNFHPYVGERNSRSYLDMSCLLCGLLGFYFGFSLLNFNIPIQVFLFNMSPNNSKTLFECFTKVSSFDCGFLWLPNDNSEVL